MLRSSLSASIRRVSQFATSQLYPNTQFTRQAELLAIVASRSHFSTASPTETIEPRKVHLSNLSPDTDEQALLQHLQRECPPHSHFHYKPGRRYAHVTFKTTADATRFIEKSRSGGFVFNGQKVEAKEAIRNENKTWFKKNLFVKFHTVLGPSVKENYLRDTLGSYGKLVDVRGHKEHDFAHVETATEATAEAIRDAARTTKFYHPTSPTKALTVLQARGVTQSRPNSVLRFERLGDEAADLNAVRTAVLATGVELLDIRPTAMHDGTEGTSGIIQFASTEDATRALSALEEQEIDGKLLRWKYGYAE